LKSLEIEQGQSIIKTLESELGWEMAKREDVEQRSKDLEVEYTKGIEEVKERGEVELKAAKDQRRVIEAQMKVMETQ